MRDLLERVGDRFARWESQGGDRERLRDMTDYALRVREQALRLYLTGPLPAAAYGRWFGRNVTIYNRELWQRRLAREIAHRRLVPLA